MPKIPGTIEELIKTEIRIKLATEPLLTAYSLSRHLAKRGFTNANGGPLDNEYIGRLIRKVNGEVLANIDRGKLKQRLALMRERHAAAFDRLFKIAYWRWEYLDEGIAMPEIKDQVKALEVIMKMDNVLLQTEMDAGIFERKLGTMKIENEHQLVVGDDAAEGIMRALRNYGIVKPTTTPELPELPRPGNGS